MKTASLKTLMITISFFLCQGLLLHAFGLSFGSLSDDKLVSLRVADAPLRQALEMLSEQTQVDFVFYDELVKGITVTCEFEEIPLEDALRRLLKVTPISFLTVSDNQTVLVTGERHRKVLLTGQVVDHDTGEPLENVNVFIANSMMGDATNEGGEFIFSAPLGGFNLVVSRLGYAREKLKLTLHGAVHDGLVIRLKPQPFQAPEIEISAEDMKEWRKNLKKFTQLFLSTTANASECKILNPEVLDFQRGKNGGLTAVAAAPLEIENRALGYKINYILEKFMASKDLIKDQGIPRFEELTPQNEKEEARWRTNRIRAYRGSFRHFLATICKNYNQHYGDPEYLRPLTGLWKGSADSLFWQGPEYRKVMGDVHREGFQVVMIREPWPTQSELDQKSNVWNRGTAPKKSKNMHWGELVNTNRFLSHGDRPLERVLSFPNYLVVNYTLEMKEKNYLDYFGERADGKGQHSLVKLNVDSLVIDTSGHFFESFGARTWGYWAWERMADRLPWDYTGLAAEIDQQLLRRDESEMAEARDEMD